MVVLFIATSAGIIKLTVSHAKSLATMAQTELKKELFRVDQELVRLLSAVNSTNNKSNMNKIVIDFFHEKFSHNPTALFEFNHNTLVPVLQYQTHFPATGLSDLTHPFYLAYDKKSSVRLPFSSPLMTCSESKDNEVICIIPIAGPGTGSTEIFLLVAVTCTRVFAEQHLPIIELFTSPLAIKYQSLAYLSDAQEARVAADRSSKFKSEFLANMSHEIRTPMNAILGMIQILASTQLTNHQQLYLSTLNSGSKSLLKIIDNIFDISKIEAGKLAIDDNEFDLHKLMLEVSSQFTQQLSEKALSFDFKIDNDVAQFVIGDELRIRQVLINLLSNAIKFTHKGVIKLALSQVEEAPTTASSAITFRFSISDTGIGIAEDKSALIFKMFEQSDVSTTKNYDGTGLGLSISQHLVQLMGGKINVKSQLNQGSQFSFDLALTLGQREEKRFEQIISIQALNLVIIKKHKREASLIEQLTPQWGLKHKTLYNYKQLTDFIDKNTNAIPYVYYFIADHDFPEIKKMVKLINQSDNSANHPIALQFNRIQHQDVLDSLFDLTISLPVCPSKIYDSLIQLAAKKSLIKQPELTYSPVFNCSILVAEDNRINQQIVTLMLNNLGCQVIMVNNGQQAVAKIQEESFDLCFMDCMMPIMDGYQAVAAIRQLPGKQIPIIALTANAMKGDREKCLASGMTDYLTKPIDNMELKRTIAYWLDLENKKRVLNVTSQNT